MTQDEVIALAHQTLPDVWRYDTNDDFATLTFDELTSFANAVEAKYRESLLAGAGEPVGWSLTCNGQHTGNFDHSKETILVKKIGMDRKYPNDVRTVEPLYTADQVAAEVLREREACAKVCDEYDGAWYVYRKGAAECANAIRARGSKA